MIYRNYVKRVVDVVLASIGLLVLGGPMLVIAAAIRRQMGSPVLFRHRRPGLYGKPFTLLKFRTMTNEVDADGELLPPEKRITRLGRLLRKTSLDELPELFNVLSGQMSLVGPRPLHMKYLELYSPEQMRRHNVRPGITGWAQINGRNTVSWQDRFALDVWYVDHLSPWLDLKIVLATIGKVLKREGISQQGYATCEHFKGNDPQTLASVDQQSVSAHTQ